METTGKTVFGTAQLNNPTPLWAKYVYRMVFALTTGLAAWIAATNLIADAAKFEWILVLKFIDPVVYVLGQMVGVDTTEQDNFYKGKTSQ